MKDDIRIDFIRLYFLDFSTAIRGRSAVFVGAYFLGLIEYLVDECKGLEDDPQVLQGICRLTDEEWHKVGPILFNTTETGKEYFRLDSSGLWHQKRARGEYEASIAGLESYRDRARMGGLARAAKYAKKLCGPPPRVLPKAVLKQ